MSGGGPKMPRFTERRETLFFPKDHYTLNFIHMGVEPKIGGKSPKMDDENNGSKPY